MITPEQMLETQKSNIETLMSLTSKAFEGIEKLVELNMQVAKTSMSELTETAKAAMSIKDAQELLAFQAGLLQPAAEKAAAYSRHLYDIATATATEVGKLTESTAADAQGRFMAAVDSAAKNAPAGSENVVAMMKSSVAAASNAFEGVQKAVKQAGDVAGANFQAMSANASKVTEAVASMPKRIPGA